MSQTRIHFETQVSANTYDEVMEKAMLIANEMGIPDPTFIEAEPAVKTLNGKKIVLWNVEIDHRGVVFNTREKAEISVPRKAKKRPWFNGITIGQDEPSE